MEREGVNTFLDARFCGCHSDIGFYGEEKNEQSTRL
jgi:hypothetical protein